MKRKTSTRVLALAATVATTIGTLVATALPASAQKLYESTRYESVEQPIANWTTYAPDGTPTGKDPNCPSFPGIRRSSKVWASAYGIDEPLHTDFRMQFHTTYSTGVATAITAFQNAGVTPTCSMLDRFQNVDTVTAREFLSCGAYTTNRPARWCAMALNHPNDPTLLSGVNTICPAIAGHAPPVPLWHEWHNLPDRVGNEAQLYNIDVIKQFASWLSSLGLSLNMPVYLDDVTIVGGVSNFNQDTAQPSSGNAWIGYGQVATPAQAEAVTEWYDAAARSLGYDPIAHPVDAHNAVDAAINAGKAPKGTNGMTRLQFFASTICPYAPKVSDLIDPTGSHSLAAIGQDLSGWVQAETGETLCQKVHEQPKFAGVAGPACNNAFVGLFFSIVDNNNCMNRPTDGIANLLNVDLGCNRDIHMARLFSQMKAFLGG